MMILVMLCLLSCPQGNPSFMPLISCQSFKQNYYILQHAKSTLHEMYIICKIPDEMHLIISVNKYCINYIHIIQVADVNEVMIYLDVRGKGLCYNMSHFVFAAALLMLLHFLLLSFVLHRLFLRRFQLRHA